MNSQELLDTNCLSSPTVPLTRGGRKMKEGNRKREKQKTEIKVKEKATREAGPPELVGAWSPHVPNERQAQAKPSRNNLKKNRQEVVNSKRI